MKRDRGPDGAAQAPDEQIIANLRQAEAACQSPICVTCATDPIPRLGTSRRRNLPCRKGWKSWPNRTRNQPKVSPIGRRRNGPPSNRLATFGTARILCVALCRSRKAKSRFARQFRNCALPHAMQPSAGNTPTRQRLSKVQVRRTRRTAFSSVHDDAGAMPLGATGTRRPPFRAALRALAPGPARCCDHTNALASGASAASCSFGTSQVSDAPSRFSTPSVSMDCST